MINAYEFTEILSNDEEEKKKKSKSPVVDFATIDPNYSGTGKPKLIFEGEETVSGKGYSYAKGITFAPNDRVILLNGVIITAIQQ